MPASHRPTGSSAAPVALSALSALAACAPAGGDAAAERLAALVAEDWEARLDADPLLARAHGREDAPGGLADPSEAARAARAEAAARRAEELRAIDPDALEDRDRVTRAMLLRELDDAVADFGFGGWQVPFTNDSGFHTALARLPHREPLATEADYERYLERLAAIPAHVDAHVANMRRGIARGMTMPRVVMPGVRATVAAHVVDDVTASAFHAPFEDFPAAVPEAARTRLAALGREAVERHAVASYRRLLAFLDDEYVPAARASIGASEWPDGAAYYAHLVRHFTTLETTPEEVHATGLEEVARIRAEMQAVIDGLGFDGDFDAFLTFLRTDPRFYARSPEELLSAASRICKRVDAELPRFFGLLPRLPYGVEPVPDSLAPNYTGGRYVPAPRGSTEAGTYWVNTYDLASRPLYVLPALSLHEAVPGHHLQIALANELEDLPPFRREAYVNAFGEGWALYCEWLGVEMGIYETPYDEFGRLTYEMWRAARLVIDTGVHAMGWDRERAIDYLASNTALSLHECTTEVDRYISWPGQALSYKTGELEIRRLRAEAERTLGAGFDLRAFHDVVLGEGTLPLAVLRARVERWIDGGGGE